MAAVIFHGISFGFIRCWGSCRQTYPLIRRSLLWIVIIYVSAHLDCIRGRFFNVVAIVCAESSSVSVMILQNVHCVP